MFVSGITRSLVNINSRTKKTNVHGSSSDAICIEQQEYIISTV